MSSEEKVLLGAAKVAVGAVAGTVTGLSNAAAPHVRAIGSGALNASSNFFNGATKALKNHKGVSGALGAGTAAVIGHGAVATAAVALAPVAAVTAVVAGASFGIYKLIKYVQDE